MKRFFAQLWWRLFGERCPCGMSFRRRDPQRRLSLCCADQVFGKTLDAAWERAMKQADVTEEGKYAKYTSSPPPAG